MSTISTRRGFLSLLVGLAMAPVAAPLVARTATGGGLVRGGSGIRDDVPMLLPRGYFISRKALKHYGSGTSTLQRINSTP